MEIKGWKYYNHAAVPTCAPHEMPDLTPIKDGSIWKLGDGKQKPLFARWSEDWDCGYDTGWYYTIMDTPFDINSLKAKRRYVINQGIKSFEVRIVNPIEHINELEECQRKAYSKYPIEHRPTVNSKGFKEEVNKWQDEVDKGIRITYAAFFCESNEMCGFMNISKSEKTQGCISLRTNPEFEKYQINAALVYQWVSDTEEFVKMGGYLENGTRAFEHETAFNEYLEKYFGFRKAYCTLKVKYKVGFKVIVHLLYYFRNVLEKNDSVRFIHLINCVLRMEAIAKNA